MRIPLCIWPSCKRLGKLTRLPLTGEHVSLCDLHRGRRFIGHMSELIARG